MSDTSQTAPPDGETRAHRPCRASRPGASSPKVERVYGYRIEVEGLPSLRCGEIRGFFEAARALRDPRAPAPARLVLLAPEGEGWPALDLWAEDAAQVRRRVTLHRCVDGREIAVIATLAVYGRGAETVLSVESIAGSPRALSSPLTRSGVHRKVDLAAVLGLGAGLELEPAEPHVFCFGACCQGKG
ncbi:MAG: hypothetical protein ABI193_15045 [Minicystis sp.]